MNGFDMGSATVRLKANLEGFNKGIDEAQGKVQGFKGKMEQLKPTFQKMAVVGTAMTAGIGAGIYKMTQDASDANEIFSKFSVVYKDNMDDAEKWANHLRNNYGLAMSSSKDLLSATGDMLTGFGMTGDMALDLSGQVQELAVDLASFTNYEGGAQGASEALTKALLGERESVKALGIAILEEDVKAKVKKMKQDGLLVGMTERQEKAYATLAIAMEQSKNATGDYERTSDSLANKQREMSERMKELRESIGVAFIPIMQTLVNTVTPLIQQFATWAQQNPDLVKKIAIVAGAITALVAVVGFLGLAIPPIIAGFVMLGAIFSPIGLAIVALVAIVAGLAWAWKNDFMGIQEKTREVIDNVMKFFNEDLMPMINAFREWWTENWEYIRTMLEAVWNIIKLVIQQAWDAVQTILRVGLALLKGDWGQAWEYIQGFASRTWERIKGVFNSMISFLKGWGGMLYNNLKEPFEKAWNKIKDIVDKIKGALDFTQRHSPSVLDIINKSVREANRAMEGLQMNTQITPKVAGAVVGNGGSTNVSHINIDMAGAVISDELGAIRIGEKIGDQIIKKLQLNVRF